MAGKIRNKEVLQMGIKHGILGPKKDTPFSRGRELREARKITHDLISMGGNIWQRYVRILIKLKIRENDLFVSRIKKISDLMIKRMGMGVQRKIRMINLFVYNLDPSEAKRFIEKIESEGR